MKNQPFLCTYKTTINAPVEKVWSALTEPSLVKQYFFDSNLETTWKVGDPIYFSGEYEGKPYQDKGTVQAYEHQKSLSYTYYSNWSGLPDEPENYQLVTYVVSKVENGSELTITQTHFTQEQADHSKDNWKIVVEGLSKIIL